MLKEILKTIEEKKQLAQTDLSSVSVNVRSMMEGKVRRAKEDLNELYVEYKNALKSRVIFIMVNGKGNKKFSDIAAKEYAGVSFAAEEFYEELASKVDKQQYLNKNMNHSTVDVLRAVLEEKATDIGIIGYPALIFKSKYAKLIKSEKELSNIITEMINDQVGAEFVGLDLLEKAAIQCVNSGFKGNVLPVLIHTQNEELLNQLEKDFYQKLTPNVFKVSAGIVSKENSSDIKVTGKITKQNVKEALIEIRENIK